MSRIRSSSATSPTAFVVAAASAENDVAQTTSVGTGIDAPRASAFSMSALASSTRSGSYSDFPTGCPAAAMKLLAMPPPTMSRSTLPSRLSSTVSLVDTFEPPTIATSGRAGRIERLPERVELAREERARAGDGRVPGDAVSRRLGPVGGAEGVHREHVAERRVARRRAPRRSPSRRR